MTKIKTVEKVVKDSSIKCDCGCVDAGVTNCVVTLLENDRATTLTALCEALEGMKASPYDEKDMSTEETASYNQALRAAIALIRTTLSGDTNETSN